MLLTSWEESDAPRNEGMGGENASRTKDPIPPKVGGARKTVGREWGSRERTEGSRG